MPFVHIVDTDENEHYVNLDAIVNVRTTMSGGTFVDVNGLEAPIFMKRSAREVVEMLITGEVLGREPQPASRNGGNEQVREPGAQANEIREPGTFIS